jgi:hypothetical protein
MTAAAGDPPLPGLSVAHAAAVLAALVERDSRLGFTLTFAEPSELVLGVSGRDVDDALREAQREGLIEGERGEGDGSLAWWSMVRLTDAGLRLLGQWPPAGREFEPGGWDAGYWGRRARPLLEQLRDTPPAHGFYFKPIGEDSDRWGEWTAILVLGDADLIAGHLTAEGINSLRLTAAAQQALNPTPPDPLVRAIAQLRSGARVDAIVTAVELVLGGRLKQLAAAHNLPTTKPDSAPLTLSRLNSDLRGAGVYDETDRAQVEAWQKVRNDLAHAQAAPSDRRIETIIAGIRVFLDEHPA